MGLSSTSLDEHGNAICVSCRKKYYVSELETCPVCGRFVCKNCGTYLKQSPYGYICKTCLKDLHNQ